MAHLINNGKVVPCGTFAGARIDLSVPVREEGICVALTKRTRSLPLGLPRVRTGIGEQFPVSKESERKNL